MAKRIKFFSVFRTMNNAELLDYVKNAQLMDYLSHCRYWCGDIIAPDKVSLRPSFKNDGRLFCSEDCQYDGHPSRQRELPPKEINGKA